MNAIFYKREIPVTKTYDILVCGAGPAGICAAVAAARQGVKVALVERYGVPGGNLTVGHVGPILGGVSSGTMRDEVCELLGVRDNDAMGWTAVAHDMHFARHTLTEFINHENIDVYLQTPIADAIVENDTIRGVIIATKEGLRGLTASVVIDATGDGDVAAFAGCEYGKGRQDGRMQPVTLEFTLDNIDEDRAIIVNGDMDDVKLNGQDFHQWCRERGEEGLLPMNIISVRLHPTVRKGERQVNTTQVNGVDSTKVETLYEAELELRRQIDLLIRFLRQYLPGYENAKLIGTAVTTGIRESRRIMGEYCIRAEELLVGKRFADVIVHKANFCVDIHNPDGPGQADSQLQFPEPYDLPYRCFVPKKIDNLYTAGRCISGTHRAHASYRVMSICMAMGEAVGVAASMCVKEGCTPRNLNVQDLQEKLTAMGIDLFS